MDAESLYEQWKDYIPADRRRLFQQDIATTATEYFNKGHRKGMDLAEAFPRKEDRTGQ